MIARLLLLVIALGVFTAPASAETFSCPGGIISEGDRSVDLVIKCGDPDWKDSHMEEVFDPHYRTKTLINVEEWTYNLGPQQFMRTVIIRNGIVWQIRTGNYGTRKNEK